jgi:hypothetical protein
MRDTYTRVLLAIVAIGYVGVGAWAALAPRSFYDDFPGGGHHWVSADGPFNEHLVRDVGTLNLALAAVTIAALVRPGRYLVQVVAGATLVYAAPHFLYHLLHLDLFDTSDKVLEVGSLAITVIVPVLLLIHAWRVGATSSASPPGDDSRSSFTVT